MTVQQLVTIQHREAMTTSLIVAEAFEKQHKNVLASINKMECSDKFRRLNFKPSFHVNEQGKRLPMFNITRDGFSFLAMGFTGKKAATFKEQFIEAFGMMERALLNRDNLEWQQNRLTGKAARRAETDIIAVFTKYAISQGSTNSAHYYSLITTMTNKALFLVSKGSPKPFRDMLDAMQLSFLNSAEYVVRQALLDGMDAGLHYKDIYLTARDRVTEYSAGLPKQKQLKGK